MAKSQKKTIVAEEKIINKIVFIRKEKVILDVHLAELYKVETRVLKQAVRRNLQRFPEDFMFILTGKEIEEVVSQNVIPHKKYLGGATPFAFTESGVAMLSSVLNSPTAIEMNIAIIRAFVGLRKLATNYRKIMILLNEMRRKYDNKFEELYTVLEHLTTAAKETRPRIGFRRKDEKD